MPFPYEHLIPPNFSHPVKGNGVQRAIFCLHFEREVLAWFDGYPLEWHAFELVFDFILVGELNFSLPNSGSQRMRASSSWIGVMVISRVVSR